MKAVITVIGKDMVGILAKVSTTCAEANANVSEVTQSIMDEYFAMIMLAEVDGLNVPFADFADALGEYGAQRGLDIHTMHEDIFNTMHHI